MDRNQVRGVLALVATGTMPAARAAELLASGPLAAGAGFVDLGFARVDTHRGLRTGDPEVVYAEGKTAAQTARVVMALRASGVRPALITRIPAAATPELREALPQARFDEVARCAVVGEPPVTAGLVVVINAAGTPGMAAAETAFVARAYGVTVREVGQMALATPQWPPRVRSLCADADCVVVVAARDGTLAGDVAGLSEAPVVAVPASAGDGTARSGLAVLVTMLNSAAPGTAVCNIDNGFGAAVLAAKIARAGRAS